MIDGQTLIPVYSYLPSSIYDDVNQKGCYYVDQCIQNQITDPKFYVANGNAILPIVGYRLGEAYNWSPSKVAAMNYLDFYLLADAIVAEKFEGSPSRSNFSEEDWSLIRNAQKVVLVKSFDKMARKLLASRNFQKPIAQMSMKAQELLSGSDSRDSLRFVLQSEHDTHIINSVTWLEPLDHDYVDMPFSSTLVMELHYT